MSFGLQRRGGAQLPLITALQMTAAGLMLPWAWSTMAPMQCSMSSESATIDHIVAQEADARPANAHGAGGAFVGTVTKPIVDDIEVPADQAACCANPRVGWCKRGR